MKLLTSNLCYCLIKLLIQVILRNGLSTQGARLSARKVRFITASIHVVLHNASLSLRAIISKDEL